MYYFHFRKYFYSFKVRSLCTPRTAKRSLFFILGFSIAYNIVRFWEYTLMFIFICFKFKFDLKLQRIL